MKKITIEGMPTLGEGDNGLVLKYFKAVAGAASGRKQAFAFGILGCFTIGMSYVNYGATGNHTEYDWFPILQVISTFLPCIAFPILILNSLKASSKSQKEAEHLNGEINTRGIDVSGLSQADILKYMARKK
jgi:hypothetical protein